MTTPVRIYLLHHPDSRLAGRMVDAIYEWFRLPSLEGIPVYVRSAPARGEVHPLPPAEDVVDGGIQYFVPLIDAHLVRDPVWHEYLSGIAQKCPATGSGRSRRPNWRMFPVALDATAFNMPEAISGLNFVRFGLCPEPVRIDPKNPTPEERRERKAWLAAECENVLKHLTEAFARDLNARLSPKKVDSRFQIFISYARADSTEVAKNLRDYIQGQTQCLVFFDENDIGFGQTFSETLGDHVDDLSRAMIVINSDHYADRPWCRWEIDRFSAPRSLSKPTGGGEVRLFHPMLVVDNLKSAKVSRVVPELGQVSVIRWEKGREALIFSSLMREVMFGLRDVFMASVVARQVSQNDVVLNRLPGPVGMTKLLKSLVGAGDGSKVSLHHPGYGLPLTEVRLLEDSFPQVRFLAFRDIRSSGAEPMQKALERITDSGLVPLPLAQKVIVLSAAHHQKDLAAIGYLPQNQDEALIHLLRPLVRLGADLLYGGAPPKHDMEAREDEGDQRNITLTLMRLLNSERPVDLPSNQKTQKVKRPKGDRSILFHPSAWPACDRISVLDEASWIHTCRVNRVLPRDAGLEDSTGDPVASNVKPEDLPSGYRRLRALMLSAMRRMIAEGFSCEIAGRKKTLIKPDVYVFMGGGFEQFIGVMPGIYEEFLHARTFAKGAAVYLLGGLGGATKVLAQALLSPSNAPPQELTQTFFEDPLALNSREYRTLIGELDVHEQASVTNQFEDLWTLIQSAHRENGISTLLQNGLTEAENRELLKTPNTTVAVNLVWLGMSRLYLNGI